MRAVVVERFQEPAELRVSEAPAPEPTSGALLVDVRAAGCNFFDTLLVKGNYQVKPALPFIPGAELAGVVRSVGDGVTGFAPGDRVMAALPFGAFAEQVSVPAIAARRVPDRLSFREAAAFPVVYPTAHAALVHRGALRAGETLLVTAAAGGVGLAAVQIGKALGARVIAIAGGAEKLAVARSAGADVAIDYLEPDWVDRARAATDGNGIDLVIENVGGDVFDGCTRLLAWEGRLVVVGFAGGRIPELKVNRVLLKHISVIGLHYGPMVLKAPALGAEIHRALTELVDSGKIKPIVSRAYPLEQVGLALEALASRKTHGKIVLETTKS
jgi:NADPH2:quinone reductase